MKERLLILNANKIDLKKSLTKMALLGALGIGATTAATLNTQTANAATNIDATHVRVDAGDTLYKIAQQEGTTVDKLVVTNHISNPNMIMTGQVLTTDGSNAQATAPAPQTTTQATTQTASNVQNNTTAAQNNSGNGQAVATTNTANAGASYSSNLGGSEQAAKDWIAQRESGGSYGATNGQYIGRYQLSSSYLHGDYSPANQERVADQYCAQRYGSWQNAKAHWAQNGWW